MSAALLRPMNAEERERRNRCCSLGCIACLMEGNGACGVVEYHHLLVAGERAGHRFGVALGAWHHQGNSLGNATRGEMTAWYGPSLKHDARTFHAAYGSDQALLDYQDNLLGVPTVLLQTRRRSRGSCATPSKIFKGFPT